MEMEKGTSRVEVTEVRVDLQGGGDGGEGGLHGVEVLGEAPDLLLQLSDLLAVACRGPR